MKKDGKNLRFASQTKKHIFDETGNSSFGKMILSEKLTEPSFIIGRAQRDKNNIGLSKKQLKTQLLGRTSPGFIYDIKDELVYKKAPIWSIGNAERSPLDNQEKYEHYFIQDKFSNVGKAFDKTQPNKKEIKFNNTRRVDKIIF